MKPRSGSPINDRYFKLCLFIIIFLSTLASSIGHKNIFYIRDRSLRADGVAITNNGKPIYLLISLIWEGSHILNHNVEAIKQLRQQFPDLAMLHFFNPAYYTKPNINPGKINQLIKNVIHSQDEVGLTIYGWKSLVQKAGVIFRQSPSFWGKDLNLTSCNIDCGIDVPIHIYRKDEIAKIIDFSLDLLSQHKFAKPRSFHAGGWLGSKVILDALALRNITFDFSGIAPHLVQPKIYAYPLFNWIAQLWPQFTPYTQPYYVKTKSQEIIEIGYSAGTIDYFTTEEILTLFKSYIGLKQKNEQKPLIFHLGFYQETAFHNLGRLKEVITNIYALAQTASIELAPFPLTSNVDGFLTQFSQESVSQVEKK